MKAEDVDKMEAGREMDEAVHRALWPEDEILQLGWCDSVLRQYRKPKNEVPHSPWFALPHYSTDIAAAWQVVEKMRELRFSVDMGTWENAGDGNNWWVDLEHLSWATPETTLGPTAPLAICRAALKAYLAAQGPQDYLAYHGSGSFQPQEPEGAGK